MIKTSGVELAYLTVAYIKRKLADKKRPRQSEDRQGRFCVKT